jgi:hypothetical protein
MHGLGSFGLMGRPQGVETGLSKTVRPRAFPRLRRSGLGAGSVTGEKIGGSILGSAGIVAAVNPIAGGIVAAVGALTELVTSFIGGGCGQACINSAQAEQIYEIAGDDLAKAYNLGMITADEYSTGIENVISAGTQHMQALEATDPSASKGLANMLKSIPSASATPNGPTPGSVPLDLSALQAAFIQPGASGWYAGSVSAGTQLALTYLQALAQLQANGVNTGNVAQALTATPATPATAATAGSPTAPLALAPGTVTQLATTASGMQVPVTTTPGSTAAATTGLSWTEIALGGAALLAVWYLVFGRE